MLITEISPVDHPLGVELLALQKAAYAVEAELIGDDRIPPLHESLEELRAQPLRWLGAVDEDGRLVGAVAWEETGDEVDVNRLVVHPSAVRRGIGRALVKEALVRAGARRVVVATGRDNSPARRLYEGLGFALAGEVEVIPGLWIANYALLPA
ncbi:acetyltransferase (GNAT) family protein [Nonomuraea polychroma]|uniref:Acetyltransferase (GNAT) family protein n=1 Tax=Nonomuraea polychroma TaxID=46176 RepID=A0A438MF14_9ACTN|nr:GNAT family N-acetyltransferase [Nonomuraea polychroma]RVX44383.1 acetyltransferase (GNAT) family protein [Nonomuraea polychroma]